MPPTSSQLPRIKVVGGFGRAQRSPAAGIWHAEGLPALWLCTLQLPSARDLCAKETETFLENKLSLASFSSRSSALRILARVSVAVIKNVTSNNVQRKELVLFASPPSFTEGSQGRDWGQKLCRVYRQEHCYWLSLHGLFCFLIQPRTTYPGLAHCSWWAGSFYINPQSRKCPNAFSQANLREEAFSQLKFFSDCSDLCQIDKTKS